MTNTHLQDIRQAVNQRIDEGGNVVVITGAGVSAESGLRTYRGDGGLWTDDGASAMTRATAAYFVRYPERSWTWHLARRAEMRRARPNAAHHALADFDRLLGDRFMLITQNIDRLHIKAGNPSERTVEIHGHIEGMRCSGDCEGVIPIPDVFDDWTEDHSIEGDSLELLTCPNCGLVTRPHVLWFDEFYDEATTGILTAQRAAATTSVCITVGTSGGVPIAERLAGIAWRAGATLIDVNPDDNRLRRHAVWRGGVGVSSAASEALPEILNWISDGAPSDARPGVAWPG
jgi:NAD-dependent deacetylase